MKHDSIEMEVPHMKTDLINRRDPFLYEQLSSELYVLKWEPLDAFHINNGYDMLI